MSPTFRELRQEVAWGLKVHCVLLHHGAILGVEEPRAWMSKDLVIYRVSDKYANP